MTSSKYSELVSLLANKDRLDAKISITDRITVTAGGGAFALITNNLFHTFMLAQEPSQSSHLIASAIGMIVGVWFAIHRKPTRTGMVRFQRVQMDIIVQQEEKLETARRALHLIASSSDYIAEDAQEQLRQVRMIAEEALSAMR